MTVNSLDPASFRDPSGFLFNRDGVLYRQINMSYKEEYEQFIHSGLYSSLVERGWLIPHQEVGITFARPDLGFKVIQPEPISFISYPYEWCFSQLKAAALLTLEIQKKALGDGMLLKDCSAYNIQFQNSRPVFIDTLSFERYREGEPWLAYRQFCQHFLAPLSLMSRTDIRLNQLLRIYIDGIPLDLASTLLPSRSISNVHLLSHIHLHSKSQSYFSDKKVKLKERKMSRLALRGLVDSLYTVVKKLRWQPRKKGWAEYYKDTNYSSNALEHKRQLVSDYLDRLKPEMVWDLGANIGFFSRLAGDKGIYTVSIDSDPAAVEKNYIECIKNGETNILPLVIDLINPSPGIGWENKERMSLLARGPADTVLALALVHHLAISNNVPFSRISKFFKNFAKKLIIEFVPKSDSQVERLLSSRQDIFKDYTARAFESEFRKYFIVESCTQIYDSERTIYLMTNKDISS